MPNKKPPTKKSPTSKRTPATDKPRAKGKTPAGNGTESAASVRGRASAGTAATAGRRPARADGTRGGLGGSPPRGQHSQHRLDVRKTYKLFIGGGFPRSDSGRSYPVTAPDGTLLAHAALASRKDARDAVTAARAAFGRWSGATAYNRGQVLYRVAEMMEGRSAQFADVSVQGGDRDGLVAAAIDRWVWYAGWPDKIAQVAGAANPVAGPYFNFSVPEP